jgi:hypothetical protein
VPKVTPAAKIEPIYQLSLNRLVINARSFGYVSSVKSEAAPVTANGVPIPRNIRETMNMVTLIALVTAEGNKYPYRSKQIIEIIAYC